MQQRNTETHVISQRTQPQKFPVFCKVLPQSNTENGSSVYLLKISRYGRKLFYKVILRNKLKQPILHHDLDGFPNPELRDSNASEMVEYTVELVHSYPRH